MFDNDDELLDARLRARGRVNPGTESARLASDLVGNIATRRRDATRRWIWGTSLVLVFAAGGTATAAAVGTWVAHTGRFGGWGSEIVDRSEWIGLDAPDAPEAIVALYEPLPLPPGASESDVVRPIAALLKTMGVVPEGESGHVTIQATGIQSLFERAGRCLWIREWLDADSRNDEPGAIAAAEGWEQSIHWPATQITDGGGITELLQSEVAEAVAGDRRGVLGTYSQGCSAYYGEVRE